MPKKLTEDQEKVLEALRWDSDYFHTLKWIQARTGLSLEAIRNSVDYLIDKKYVVQLVGKVEFKAIN